jgi:hypothetical protein
MKPTRLIACAAILAAFASPAQAQLLYGASASGTPGELYILNPANGTKVQDIGPLMDSLGQNYPVTGLAFAPDGTLYGSTGNSGGAASWARLVKINPATALVTVIGLYNAGPTNASGDPATMSDINFAPNGTLYGVGSIGGPDLYTIDILTGQATHVGANGVSTSTSGGGLAISSSGVFYGTPTASRFGTYDPTTGAYTNVGNPTKPGGGSYAALAFGPTGLLYGMNSGAGAPPPNHLVTIDPATATVTDLGLSDVTALDAIAFSPAAVPEPGSLCLVGGAMAAAAAVVRRRRKVIS